MQRLFPLPPSQPITAQRWAERERDREGGGGGGEAALFNADSEHTLPSSSALP